MGVGISKGMASLGIIQSHERNWRCKK